MTNDTNRLERIRSSWTGLTDREQKLMMLLAVVLVSVLSFLMFNFFKNRLSRYNDGIDRGREALDLLADSRGDWQQARDEAAEFEERLANNSLRLAAFAEELARGASVASPRDFRDEETPVPNHPGVLRRATTVTFPNVPGEKMGQMLSAIESSPEIVFLERFEMAPLRESGVFELELKLTTFVRGTR